MSQISPSAVPTAHPSPQTEAQAEGQGMARSLSGLLVANLCDTMAALGGMMQARQMRLALAPALHGHAAPLRRAGLSVETVEAGALGAADGVTLPLLRDLPRQEGQPTDLVDLAMDLVDPAGQPLARLDLLDVPGGWNSRARLRGVDPLARQLLRQVLALKAGACLLAPPMLALLARLREFDDHAASHLVTGFLQVMAGGSPAQVEVTALRIAGLSEMPAAYRSKADVTLNDVAMSLLDELGLGLVPGQEPLAASAAPEAAAPLAAMPQRPALGLMPFARLHLLETDYDVAEDDATALLWFRPMREAHRDWAVLDSRAVDGWTVVATEILGKTVDIQRAFATMHVIRRRDIPTEEVAEIYDLHGLIWWLRHGEAGPEARLDGGQWSAYPAPAQCEGKARAVEALFHLVPNLSNLLGHKAQDWANRMAQTVQVAPVLVQAAE
jgi:hypothetical protein